ncbi:MAG: penicillin-binding protein 2 [Acidobacteriota bacterium]
MMSDAAVDRQRTGLRLGVLQVGAGLVFAVLAVSFWYLQVVRNAQYRELAEQNHQRRLALQAPRGVLFDRDFNVVVENRHALSIAILKEHTADLDKTVRLLAAVTGVSEQQIRDRVNRNRGVPSFRPIVVIEDASLAQVAAVLARRLDFELPGVLVQRVPTRQYPTDGLAAHLLGYVGEVTSAQLAADTGLRSGDLVGQSGVERAFNRQLMGTDGERRVTVNSVGREIATLEEIDAVEGNRVQLTIDLALQKAVEEAFHALGYNGAAVVLDPRTGEVLALVSLPAYDPNAFASGIDRVAWAELNTNPLLPLQNRAIQGRYSPGSTFKVVVAAAALEEGLVTADHRIYCPGGATFYGRFFQCNQRGGHGWVDLRHAIERSCNVYFYTLGNMVGVDRIHKWAVALGLSGISGIDLPGENPSLVPSTEWKRQRTGEKWYAGETISVSIGQGQVSVTPLALAATYAAVANGGRRVTPRLLKAIDDGHGWTPVPARPPGPPRLSPDTVAALHGGLWLVVNGAGTGGRARIDRRDVSGKTGTAQVISLEGSKLAAGRTDLDLRDHGWFAFFAPRDNPEIAGVILAEHAEHGYLAAPIARHLLETYFAKRDGLPAPALPAPPRAQVASATARGDGR